MKPTVITNVGSSPGGGGGNVGVNAATTTNGINIPINREFGSGGAQPAYHSPHAAFHDGGPSAAFGSPGARAGGRYANQQQQPPSAASQQQPSGQQQQPPPQSSHFQPGFGFDSDMDMDMFPRSRLGRMHDPFAGFGGTHFGFPEFGSIGRRRAGADAADDDFFTRLPSEFRQYIPESFAHRRGPTNTNIPTHQPQTAPQPPPPTSGGNFYSNYPSTSNGTAAGSMPPPLSRKVCDAAIQTEDPFSGRSEVDSSNIPGMHSDNLNQHGLRNTMDMGVRSAAENEMHGPRAHSAPPPEQLQQQQQRQVPSNGKYAASPSTPPTAPETPYQKAYYAPQSQPHPQQKQQTPPPQTPGGSYIRTIPIFVEGRTEPIINSHKEIPNQNNNDNARGYGQQPQQQTPPTQPQQQQQQQPQAQYYPHPSQYPPQHPPQHRPPPLNTQQPAGQPPMGPGPSGVPPQTPHTMDSINKIQDIQRDVLDLMAKVENFGGMRLDKEYVYLDEMLTRNLLKLDTIDTNGKESIRLARKEAIKCIQASINVLEAKAEENARRAKAAAGGGGGGQEVALIAPRELAQSSGSGYPIPLMTASQTELAHGGHLPPSVMNASQVELDGSKLHEPIPLPPPQASGCNCEAEAMAPRNSSSATSVKSQREGTPLSDAATTSAGGAALEASSSGEAVATAESK